MLTIFATPKPFARHVGVIQRNAIMSWTLLPPRPEIILFGNEEGAAEAATAIGVLDGPQVMRNEFGTPLLHDLFQKAKEKAKHQTPCFVNADVMLLNDFLKGVTRVHGGRQHLMVGKRWDVDILEPIKTDIAHAHGTGTMHFVAPDWQSSPEWIDYFALNKRFGEQFGRWTPVGRGPSSRKMFRYETGTKRHRRLHSSSNAYQRDALISV